MLIDNAFCNASRRLIELGNNTYKNQKTLLRQNSDIIVNP